MLSAILVIASPFAVKYATNLIKHFPAILPKNGWRVPVVRVIVAILSLVAAVLTQALGEGTVDPALVETSVLTVINGVVATGLYFYFK